MNTNDWSTFCIAEAMFDLRPEIWWTVEYALKVIFTQTALLSLEGETE